MDSNLYPFKRYKNNPILSREDIPYPCNTVFNAAACKFQNQYLLLLRIENLKGHSHLTIARSDDGYNFEVDKKPWITPTENPQIEIYERYGIEDPRITQMGDTFFITYTAFGPYGPRAAIGYTKDFISFKRISMISVPDDKDAVLFPEKINGKYAVLNRPQGFGKEKGAIWITYSPDLIHWGKSNLILAPEAGWGPSKIGMCTPPIKTSEGWLALYHGVRETGGGRIYRVGAMLLDLKNPEKILGLTPHFIFGPELPYERIGDVPNVVFPCGAIVERDNTLKLYYGAADTCVALAETTLEKLISLCKIG